MGTAVETVHAVGEALVAANRVTDVLALRPTLYSPTDPVALLAGAFGAGRAFLGGGPPAR